MILGTDKKMSSLKTLDGRVASARCRGCDGAVSEVLSFGEMPLANALLGPDDCGESEARFPLTLSFCPTCALVQLVESIDPARLFRDYLYASSNSPSFLGHAKTLAQSLIQDRGLDANSLVVELGSNDGYLLQHYRDSGIAVLGIEPATEIANIARRQGIPTESAFFSRDFALGLSARGVMADVVHANNVLAHVPDLPGFVAGIGALLKPEGVAVIEFPYLLDLVEGLEFDSIYHEHRCYFSLTPLIGIFRAAGLAVVDVERLDVHGGSLRLFASHQAQASPSPAVAAMLAAEQQWGVGDIIRYRRFADAVRAFQPKLGDFLGALRRRGHSIAAYGASAKGAVLLNYCGVGRELLDFVVDASPLKQGLAMPGVRLPILPTEELRRRQPDFALLLAWNFAEEIAAQQDAYLQAGGRFIMPTPEPHLYGA